ncbi:unnamed protein product [Gongylonema pulchrum]|uniref:Uncharacterized protein n=1 Tax=Gongylonema pulchrum TaxID=637853 RepID=A0A183EEF4_9BILA|nr:unnamed protein product [Gongylonema pulchrum]
MLLSKNVYDTELVDSDDSFDSQGELGMNNDEAVQALETKVDTLLYRLHREEERKNSYKQKLISEKIIRQHVESKFVGDIQRLTQLVNTLKKEQISYRNRIRSSLFSSPPSTSNGQASMLTVAELACSATSGSTAPLQSSMNINSLQEEGVDELKNFRINEVSEFA